MLLRVFPFLTLLLIIGNADAQTYIGITGDFGNQVSPKPSSDLMKSPRTPSVSVKFLIQKQIQDHWQFQYGAAAGVLGYNFKILLYDTLPGTNNNSSYVSFPSFTTFYLSGNFGIGRHFRFNRRYMFVNLGGGLTFYTGLDEVGKAGSSPSVILFEYEMSRKDNKPKAFMEVSVQTNISSRILMGLRYLHHFNPALEGSYKFNHARSSGQLTLTQRALSILFLIKLGKKVSFTD
jgi:hypothetical protein